MSSRAIGRYLLAVGILCLVSVSMAQLPPVHNRMAHDAVSTLMNTGRDLRPTGAELRMAAGVAGGGVVRRVALTAGRAMPYVGLALIAWELVDTAMDWNANRANPVLGPNDDVNCQFGLLPPSECTQYPELPDVVWPAPQSTETWVGAPGEIPWFYVNRNTYQGPYRIQYSNSACGSRSAAINSQQNYMSQADVAAFFESWWNDISPCLYGEESVPWEQQLAEGVDGMQSWVTGNVNDYWNDAVNSPGYPATYGSPIPGVTFTPSPNVNQWFDNPYADPAIDTDGDGHKDWEEKEAGTDPNDDDSYPTVPVVPPVPQPGDPDYDPENPPETMPDRDGDGIPDEYDPCGFDALNRCMDLPEPETPEDYAREDTVGEIRDLLEEIRDQEQEEAEEPAPQDFGPLSVVLPNWEPGAITGDVFDSVSTALETAISGAVTAADGKLPFFASGWVPIVSLSGGGTCESISMTILGTVQDVGVCDSPVHTVLATTVRTALLAVMVIAFWLSMARWVSVT